MKLKTSVSLSDDLVEEIDRAAREGENRSQAIERLLREKLAAEARRAAELRDIEIIAKHADELNREAEDVLRYQAEL